MNIALLTAFIAIMFVPMGTAWIIALGKAPARVAYRRIVVALTINVVALIAVHAAFYATFNGEFYAFLGFITMYLVALALNGFVVAWAFEYIGKHSQRSELPKVVRGDKWTTLR